MGLAGASIGGAIVGISLSRPIVSNAVLDRFAVTPCLGNVEQQAGTGEH
jgi:hypothetical protein